MTASPQEVETETLASLDTATRAIGEKAPDEADAYRQLVLSVASAVAEAKGGVRPVEEAVLEKIRAALGWQPAGSRVETACRGAEDDDAYRGDPGGADEREQLDVRDRELEDHTAGTRTPKTKRNAKPIERASTMASALGGGWSRSFTPATSDPAAADAANNIATKRIPLPSRAVASGAVDAHAGLAPSGAPWQRFHFSPEPHVHGSLRPRRASSSA